VYNFQVKWLPPTTMLHPNETRPLGPTVWRTCMHGIPLLLRPFNRHWLMHVAGRRSIHKDNNWTEHEERWERWGGGSIRTNGYTRTTMQAGGCTVPKAASFCVYWTSSSYSCPLLLRRVLAIDRCYLRQRRFFFWRSSEWGTPSYSYQAASLSW
jgi:hypothetical protein